MNELMIYALLELTYAEKNGVNRNELEYAKKVREILPNEWYLLSYEDRINILNSAIRDSVEVTETNEYNGVLKNIIH